MQRDTIPCCMVPDCAKDSGRGGYAAALLGSASAKAAEVAASPELVHRQAGCFQPAAWRSEPPSAPFRLGSQKMADKAATQLCVGVAWPALAHCEAERLSVPVIVHTSVAVAELAACNAACVVGVARLAPTSFPALLDFWEWRIRGAVLR